MHCWNSVEKIQWHIHTHTPSQVFGSLSFSHTYTLTHSLSHVPLCWHIHQRRSVFIRSPPGLHYLELLMQWAMWTWNWKQMLNSVAKSLWLLWPYRLLPMGLCVCVCACMCVCLCSRVPACVRMCLFDQKKKTFPFRIWVNCVSHKPKDFGAVSTFLTIKCSHVSFVVLLVLAVILDMKLG